MYGGGQTGLQVTTAADVVQMRRVPRLMLDSENDGCFSGETHSLRSEWSVNDMLAQLASCALLATADDEPPIGYELLEEDQTVGVVSPNVVVREMVDRAVKNGFRVERQDELVVILASTDEVGNTQASVRPPLRVEPLQMLLRNHAVPFRCHEH